jgi:hypothetical protein
MKKNIRNISMVCITLTTILFSCVRTDYTADTPHPTQAAITIIPDWSNIDSSLTPPSLRALIGAQWSNLGANGSIPLLDPGAYRILLYNSAEPIQIVPLTDSRVPIFTDETIARLPIDSAGFIPSTHEWFFSGYTDIVVEADKNYTKHVVMHQHSHALNIEITITEGNPERIDKVTAELSGVARSWNLISNTPYGRSARVASVLSRNNNKLTGQMILFGINDDTQILKLHIKFNDGHFEHVIYDVSSLLATFNTDKTTPTTLRGNLITPVLAGFQATITNWEVVTGSVILN